MQIGIVSDIHDHLDHLRVAIRFLNERAEAMICCGDLCSPFVMDTLREFRGPVHIVFGNNDADTFRITRKSDTRLVLHGEFAELSFDGRRVAIQHFGFLAHPIAESGRYDLVCFGHNHRIGLRATGRTLAVNPGTLMGYAFGPVGAEKVPHSFALYDTQTAAVQAYSLDLATEVPAPLPLPTISL